MQQDLQREVRLDIVSKNGHKLTSQKRRPATPVEKHEHYIALVWTDNNKYSIRSSADLKFCRTDILSEAIPRFEDFVGRINDGEYSIYL